MPEIPAQAFPSADEATRRILRLRGFPLPLAAAIRALGRDHRSGSVQLALQACQILERCEAWKPGSKKGAQRARINPGAAARAVARAQPSMAAVWNVCHRWLRRVEADKPPHVAAREVARELARAQHAVAARAATLIRNGATVLTYSTSSTVLAALLEARKRRRFRVLCSEGRPMREGRTLALRLAETGVPVAFFTDAGLLAALPEADLILMGCDAILPQGFVNKVGTAAILCLANHLRIPFYILADSFKFLPASAARSFRMRAENPAEVWDIRNPRFSRNPRNSRKNLSIRNFYFEQVPFRGCAGVVTEQGVWTPQRVARHLRSLAAAAPGAYASK